MIASSSRHFQPNPSTSKLPPSSSSHRLSSTTTLRKPTTTQSLPLQPTVPATTTVAVGPVKAITRQDKGKLTEQWGPPPVVIQREPGGSLKRGDLLGEGGFARVYLATERDGTEKAVKVIAKEQLKSTKTKSKLFGEIKIHQAMLHPNIISFEHCFEDVGNVYMQLELCANGSLLDLLRRRRRYTEPEARYYLVQLIGACDYMHSNSVIHRDLKLGNLMLDADMKLKVGDFGLAALVKFPGERKKTICGTPNYIAPEILFDQSNGHSFEVDIWSIGVILYTLLVGKPPFQTKDVKTIYRKIKELNYVFPSNVAVSAEAIDLIEKILTVLPHQRPTLAEILSHSFFTSGPFPASISQSTMDQAPDFRQISIRASHRNFKTVKRDCGIVDLSDVATVPTTRTVPLSIVVEGEEEEVPGMMTRVVGTAQESRGMEKEVREVLQPGSPISELLRSARKPLMVSPNAEPKALLQRKQLAEARAAEVASTRPTRQVSSKENLPARETNGRNGGGLALGEKAVKRTMPLGTLSPSRQMNVVVPPTAAAVAVRLVPMKKEVLSTTDLTHHPARELYDITWKTLHNALSITTTTELDALPNPIDPAAPKVFLTSWVDYTHKYGTAFSLTDGTAGLYFNDSTTMVLSPDKIHFDYISNRKGNIYSRRHYDVKAHPKELERKVYLLEYFEDYMRKTLTREVSWKWNDVDRTKNMEFLVKYYKMENAIVFKLSNEVLQFNFYDHTKMILTHSGSVISFISADFTLQVYSLHALFREASRVGYYRAAGANDDADPKRLKRLDKVRFLISKVEYCRTVLKSLAMRKSSPVMGSEV